MNKLIISNVLTNNPLTSSIVGNCGILNNMKYGSIYLCYVTINSKEYIGKKTAIVCVPTIIITGGFPGVFPYITYNNPVSITCGDDGLTTTGQTLYYYATFMCDTNIWGSESSFKTFPPHMVICIKTTPYESVSINGTCYYQQIA